MNLKEEYKSKLKEDGRLTQADLDLLKSNFQDYQLVQQEIFTQDENGEYTVPSGTFQELCRWRVESVSNRGIHIYILTISESQIIR